MRTLACLLASLAMAAGAYGQGAPSESAGPPSAWIAIGGIAVPAWEGGGPWFMPGVRLSAPLGARVGVDLDAGGVYGASSKYADIRRFYAGQLRVTRRSRSVDNVPRYWLGGLKYFKTTKLDGHGSVVNHQPHTALSIGHGWSQVWANGTRVVNEIGFSGGDGFMVYTTVGVQWGPPRKRPS
jgi:hypothetical protein